MFSQVTSATVCGVEGRLIQVEADVSNGFPSYTMVGYLASEVREARERVLTALKNAGVKIATGRIVVNLSPAGIRKQGTAFDLSIAAALMSAMGMVSQDKMRDTMLIGELSLDGTIQPVRGVLAMVCKAKEEGLCQCVVPRANASEAALVKEMKVLAVENLTELFQWMRGKMTIKPISETKLIPEKNKAARDFAEIYGQELMKCAIETAVAGRHHVLIVGPPGSGKSLAAACMPSIMPEMSYEECLEVAKMYSIAGIGGSDGGLMRERPFRQPHHSISPHAMIGGGIMPMPGEISLAHHGILFLDEFAEFDRRTIEALRQPIEHRRVIINRIHGSYEFPGDFILVAAMNPCPCGYYPDRQRCRCSNSKIKTYLGKISGPMLDRFDIGIEVHPVEFKDIHGMKTGRSSAVIREEIEAAGEIQRARFKKEDFAYNGQIPAKLIKKYCVLTKEGENLITEAYERLHLSARGYHKILKTARTVADLNGSEKIEDFHLTEAMSYRSIDEKYWIGEVGI